MSYNLQKLMSSCMFELSDDEIKQVENRLNTLFNEIKVFELFDLQQIAPFEVINNSFDNFLRQDEIDSCATNNSEEVLNNCLEVIDHYGVLKNEK
ncbi:hypothetical protein [Ureaplasma urealyticum]|uniref:Asp-tRNA(Asn)/Glu-tRNA(Gln) amidotransferase subunit GatC n=3 Tax=Ureaplasma urealyticum TaxID=2130 RepID=A0AAP9AD84_UREUR|nr:hypothetical protein [Ureaplasma urealyticum]EDX53667.1 conserved hypothetical protein [Ureaplasma urealyticum serovar 9 str. ATCC 33175]ACI60001.1 conserved hypothetical protein [Ureaplasma urealyticum serovar 10 str. ATCC 33699]EDT49525.1 conserved hypothetical protein [Ureaplasma urealyticum serovar 13 str. ATCC 33698]EDU06043.1 conserved hypothetical protein [Ureaplasma urealyticum serovar 5 str. ATCC 27817]EDU57142.1 conserved hypothetical protein [Ureaplasma urealyticum serovar 7 str.